MSYDLFINLKSVSYGYNTFRQLAFGSVTTLQNFLALNSQVFVLRYLQIKSTLIEVSQSPQTQDTMILIWDPTELCDRAFEYRSFQNPSFMGIYNMSFLFPQNFKWSLPEDKLNEMWSPVPMSSVCLGLDGKAWCYPG